MNTEPDLARLILDAKGDRSYERMSIDCGGLPTDKRLQQLATAPVKAFPDVATIRGLARGTGTTETAVVLAAARSLGLKVHSGDDPDALVIGGAMALRPSQKGTIAALVRVFRETNADARVQTLEAKVNDFVETLAAMVGVLEERQADGLTRSEVHLMYRVILNLRSRIDEVIADELPILGPEAGERIAASNARLDEGMKSLEEIMHTIDGMPNT